MGRIRNQAVTNNDNHVGDTQPPATPHGAPPEGKQRQLGNAAFLGGIVALVLVTAVILAVIANQGGSPSKSSVVTPPETSVSTPTVSSQPSGARTFPTTTSRAGLMQPSVDAHGNVWVGAMDTNQLLKLDPTTGKYSAWTPPNGKYNIMQTVTGPDGAIWFTEQAGNYVGRFDPTTQQFKTYPLGQVNGRGMAPQDLQFDTHGQVWFTELSGSIGKLDPATGNIQQWTIPAPRSGQKSYPFSLDVAADGTVWFSYLTGGALGQLDPTSNTVTVYALPTTDAQVYSMTSDGDGDLWFTEMQPAKLGRLDTQTGAVSEIDVPATYGSASSLYAVRAAKNGDIWFASAGANAIVRYAPTANDFRFYRLNAAESLPFGLDFDAAGRIWFSADGDSGNYVGVIQP